MQSAKIIENFENIYNFSIYPNPTNSNITISCHDNITEIEIIDFQGQIVKSKLVQSSIESIDLSEFKEGIYFLKIKNGTNTCIQKVCKVNN